jgi:hypothetical protein
MIQADDKTAMVANVPWLEIPALGNCDEFLLSSPAIRKLVPKIDYFVRDANAKADELVFSLEDEGLPILPRNELVAIVIYTHDLKLGKEQNLFYQLNQMLRKRGAKEREEMLKTWGTYMRYFMGGLSRLPDVECVCYRGFPHLEVAKQHYRRGRPIQWGAFSSATRSLEVAKMFAGMNRFFIIHHFIFPSICHFSPFISLSLGGGVIFKIDIFSGKDIVPYSFFPTEDEILLSPNHRFTVTSDMYEKDGYHFIDLLQIHDSTFFS